MKKISLCAMALAAITLFSCTKENEPSAGIPDNNETISVTLKVNSPGDLGKSIETPAVAGDKVLLTNGLVFFINPQGFVMNVKDIVVPDIVTGGQTFTGIKSNSSEVLIVGNYQGLLPSVETDLRGCLTKAAVKTIVSSIDNQQIVHKNVVVSNIIDATNFLTHDGLIKKPASVYEAYVLLAPVLSRIQIADIKTIDPNIVSFKVKGIYIDNFYPSFFVAATDKGGSSTIKSVGTSGPSLGTLSTKLFDTVVVAIADGGDKKVTASDMKGTGSGLVWAYQTTPTNTGYLPRIVVKITNLVIKDPNGGTDITLPGTRYLTVTGYKVGSNPVVNFEAGKIYDIPADGFTFTYKDLGDSPNAANINVIVYATIKPWQIVTTTPQL